MFSSGSFSNHFLQNQCLQPILKCGLSDCNGRSLIDAEPLTTSDDKNCIFESQSRRKIEFHVPKLLGGVLFHCFIFPHILHTSNFFLTFSDFHTRLQAPEELCSRSRSQQLELRFLRQLLQLHSATLQKIKKEADQLEASDQKGNQENLSGDKRFKAFGLNTNEGSVWCTRT